MGYLWFKVSWGAEGAIRKKKISKLASQGVKKETKVEKPDLEEEEK